jgi:hypothetical protein
MTKAFSEEKRQEWKRLVGQWEKTDRNISGRLWCREQNINYNAFVYWNKRFSSKSVKKIDRSVFQELSNSAAPSITLEYNQIRIQLTQDFDAAILAKCLRVLKEAI